MSAHKEVLNKHKVNLLRRMAEHTVATGKNEVPTGMFEGNASDYASVQKLRYHALIFRVKRGVWGVTSHGFDFIAGHRSLPKHVWIEDNKIASRADELVSVRDIDRTAPIVATTFEYRDDRGNPAGVRPFIRPSVSKQVSLL